MATQLLPCLATGKKPCEQFILEGVCNAVVFSNDGGYGDDGFPSFGT